ncbi:MAG: NAD(P)-dependent oxidoreductase [Candidatus Paceibacterota bacterium]|jgi:uronate dehydrogenase
MKILITGASGTIGSVLLKCLSGKHAVIGVDKIPSSNVMTLDIVNEQEQLRDLLKGVDVVIHLAWDVKEAGTALNVSVAENKIMGEIMYAISLEQKVKRFILASSVHVSFGHINYRHPGIVENHSILHKKKITTQDDYFPLGIYGTSKVYLEILGKAYSEKGLQVVAVRFGNVTDDNSFGEYPFWLSHRDCCQFIEKCVVVNNLPKYSVFFAISDNPCNPFDLSDARLQLGYEPKDKSECPNLK